MSAGKKKRGEDARESAEDQRIVTVETRTLAYQGKYRVWKTRFSFDAPDGSRRYDHVEREIFDRGDSAAALIHDVERDVVILTEQFRIAAAEKGSGYLLELAAGSVEEGEEPEACMRRELLEETGYRARKMHPIATVYASPGAASERVHLFYAKVKPDDLVDPDAAGVAAENEAIRRVEVPRKTFLKRCRAGAYADSKILIAGLWLAARK